MHRTESQAAAAAAVPIGDPPPPTLRHAFDAPLAGPAAAPARAAPFDAEQGPRLTVQMLDGFQVWVGGEPLLELRNGKMQDLLKLLLLRRRRPLARARICSTFWPNADADNARNSLNVTLHRLRRALGRASQIRCGSGGYQLLHAGPVWLDTEQFSLHAEMGQLEEGQGRIANAIGQYEAALAIYRSDLLDQADTDDPLAADAQALRERLNEVLERLARLHERAGQWHACMHTALRHLGLDECNEQAHRRLMRCYAMLGQVQLAERQYRLCVSWLRQQFGIGPSDETNALYRRIAARLEVPALSARSEAGLAPADSTAGCPA